MKEKPIFVLKDLILTSGLSESYRAVDEEGPEDDYSQQDRTGSLDNLEVAVLVGEEDHHRETADDDALEDEEDGPEDHVEGDNAGGAVLAVVTALGTLETLELSVEVVECQVLSLQTTNMSNCQNQLVHSVHQ